MPDSQSLASTRDFGFLLVPNFTLLAYSSAIEPLRMANMISNEELYRWHTLSADGEPVASSSGVRIPADRSIDEDTPANAVFVCGGIHIQKSISAVPMLTFSLIDSLVFSISSRAPLGHASVHLR